MNMKIISDEKNVLLKRREVIASVDFTEAKTPSREILRKEAAKLLKAKEEMVLVNKVSIEYGTQTARVDVLVYDDEVSMKAIEEKYIIKKHAPKEQKKKEEAETTESSSKVAEAKSKAPDPEAEKKEEVKKETAEAPAEKKE